MMNTDKIWMQLNQFIGFFFPLRVRRYLSFRWVTVFVLCTLTADLLFCFFLASPKDRAQLIAKERVWHNPIFLTLYNIALFLTLSFVLATKSRAEHAYLRALIFGIVLAGMLGQMLIFFSRW